MIVDYVTPNVIGTWLQVKSNDLFKSLYSPLVDLDLSSLYFMLNVQSVDALIVPKPQSRIVISFHTEYYNYSKLLEFFNKNSTCQFLLLSDGIKSNIWPDNVTYVTWISYGYQIELAKSIHGHCTHLEPRTHIFSSLSYRHEFHKAAVTAYLINEYSADQYIMSWHDQQLGEIYYKDENFSHYLRIQHYLCSDKFTQLGTVKLDSFKNRPIDNGNWKIPAYLNCQFNLTNESIYNVEFSNGRYTTPYLTEKTWKPLLAAQPFLPIGQAGTFNYLTALGLVFDYGFDISYDQCQQDYDRMEKIYLMLDQIKNIDRSQAQQSADYNLHTIVSGEFGKNCVKYNIQQMNLIDEWINAN